MWIHKVKPISVYGDIVLTPTEGRARNQGGLQRADGDTDRKWDGNATELP